MALIKMIAKQDFVDQEGDMSEGQEFFVNEERAHVLTVTGLAERSADQSSPAVEPQPVEPAPRPLGVPRARKDEPGE